MTAPGTGADPIRDVLATVVHVPLDRPVAFSTRWLSHREYVLVRLVSADGSEGVGFTYAGNQGAELVARQSIL